MASNAWVALLRLFRLSRRFVHFVHFVSWVYLVIEFIAFVEFAQLSQSVELGLSRHFCEAYRPDKGTWLTRLNNSASSVGVAHLLLTFTGYKAIGYRR